jgi:hypothetical protein
MLTAPDLFEYVPGLHKLQKEAPAKKIIGLSRMICKANK